METKFTSFYVDLLPFRYGTGLGLIAPILGEHHFLNQRNAFYGILVYFVLFILSKFL